MKTYTTKELQYEIFLTEGSKFTSTEWKEGSYIELQNGQIVDNEGTPYNLMSSVNETWIIYIEDDTKTMTKEETLKALFNNKRVMSIDWEDGKYIIMENGQIVDNEGNPYNFMSSNHFEWKEYATKTNNADTNNKEILELRAMVEKLASKLNNSDTTHTEIIPKTKDTGGNATDSKIETANLIFEVYEASTPNELKEQFKEALENAQDTREIEKIVCEYIPFCWIGGRALSTTKTYYSAMRKTIGTLENETHRELALALFLPPQRVYDVVQDKVIEKKKEEIRNKKTFNLEQTKRLIKELENKIKNDTYDIGLRQSIERERIYHIYTYLTMVTCRRQSEILNSLKIKKKNKTWYYEGIRKDDEDGKTIEAYTINNDFEFLQSILEPLQDYIDDAIEIKIQKNIIAIDDEKEKLETYSKLHTKYHTEDEINKKFNGTFNKALKRITHSSHTSSDWREIGAEIIWLEQGKGGSYVDRREFVAKVLGHKHDNKLSTPEHYDGYEAV
ncbi:MAG: hypothetical protein L3J43_04830 [Sulfurovum sp.]|nr:hypothetical protein [Sulfurovum sp.]